MELAVGLDGDLVATLRFTDRADGDLAVSRPPGELAPRRRAVADGPWIWLHQVHGDAVVVVDRADDLTTVVGSEADAAATALVGPVLAVHTADCAPVGLVAHEGVVAAVHAGWRGLRAGILARSVEAVRLLGGRHLEAYLGPCIGPECYEFGPDDLADLRARLGPEVASTTSDGRPALDLRAGVAAALAEHDVPIAFAARTCTACHPGYHSHRAHGDVARQALAVRLSRRVP